MKNGFGLTGRLALLGAVFALLPAWAGCVEVSEILSAARPDAADDGGMDDGAGVDMDDAGDDADGGNLSEDDDASGDDEPADDDASDDDGDASDDDAPGDVGPVRPDEDVDDDDIDGDTAGDMNDDSPDSDSTDDDSTDDDDPSDEDGVPPLPDDAVLLTSDTGLQTYDFSVGDGDTPALTSRVRVNYTGYLEDGTIFDSGEGTEFTLTGVIDGFAEGIAGMQVGGRRRMIIPPDIGYGASGNPGAGIGPDDNLIFDVDLLEIVTP